MKIIILKVLVFVLLSFSLILACVLFSPDRVSEKLRNSVELSINSYIDDLAERAATGNLDSTDNFILKSCLYVGLTVSKFKYPEAATLLHHYIHGDGADLELDSKYFKNSSYLQGVISELGTGDHGPLSLRQSQDWRLSLALNPYYLKITSERVRLYHPEIRFAPVSGRRVHTIVPIGKLRIKVFDNLISALNPSAFFVYSEWLIEKR